MNNQKLKKGDRVKLPFDETGTLVRFQELIWASRWWVRIRKSNGFNKTNQVVDFFPNQLELEQV
jgi:hypothetical protein